MTISVCIVDDNKDIRSALEQIILMADGYTLAGSYSDAEEALQKIPGAKPNIVLMDINLGEGDNGIDCVRQLKPQYPDILFMMCTVYEEDEKIFEALKAGANGYILKKTAPGKLLDALRELYEGGAPMSSQIARKVVNAFQVRTPGDDPTSDAGTTTASPKTISILSNRENEILELLARGMLYKEIAARLYISQETVRKHVYHIYEKLHVNNRVEAINKFYGR
ncbi:MAG TPA: response regulator transcription factor [Puia sp.]|jgi:DNA-binding NarL/FixJ family response regulator|nr:response regulator transcription factor [Puia sp.]